MDKTLEDQDLKLNKIIAIIGGGLIGQAWSVVFLRAGFKVHIFDTDKNVLNNLKISVTAKLKELASFGLMQQDLVSKVIENLSLYDELEAAVNNSDYVQECGPENLEIKSALTKKIDKFTPDRVPIGSSTSGIPSSLYAAEVKGRNRCLVVHPINPPHLIPAVEIVPSKWTDSSISSKVAEIISAADQTPIMLDKEIEGFVVNRLQGALLSEAFRLLTDGVASYEAIDKAVSEGLGMRWSFMGPFETIHLNAPGGVAQYIKRYGSMYHKMFENQKVEDDWSVALDQGLDKQLCKTHPISNLEQSWKERDQNIMRSLVHKHGTSK